MKKDKNNTNFRDWMFFIIPIILSIILCTNGLEVFAHLNIERFQVEYADDCRVNYDITNALIYYEKIGKKNSKYAPYANLACAQIHNEQQNYEKAIEFYKKAMVSNDIRVLSSCLNFGINQINDNSNKKENTINLFDDENIDFLIELLNKINEISPDTFYGFEIDFPVDDVFIKKYFSPDSKITIKNSYWKYDYTLVSTDGSLAYVNENERQEYVTSWSEPLCSTSFDIVVKYKYYHYCLATETKDVSTFKAMADSISKYKTIEDKPIKYALEEFEKQEEVYEKG